MIALSLLTVTKLAYIETMSSIRDIFSLLNCNSLSSIVSACLSLDVVSSLFA